MRAFMRALSSGAWLAEKDIDHLTRHVERSENHPGQHEVIRHMRSRPVPRRVKNFFFRPAPGKKERHATERHHPDRVRHKRDRHEAPEAAHFTNVLFAMTSVNNRACAEEKERLEKAVCEQVQDSCSNTAHTQGAHHQTEL